MIEVYIASVILLCCKNKPGHNKVFGFFIEVIALLKNQKWEAFCLHFVKSGNAAEAYRAAGYKPKNNETASANARRLLQKDSILKRIEELTEEIRSEKIANAAEMQEILTRIARQEQQEEVVVVEGVEKGVSEARIVTKKPSNQDAIKAINQLARMQGIDNGGSTVNIVIPLFGGDEALED